MTECSGPNLLELSPDSTMRHFFERLISVLFNSTPKQRNLNHVHRAFLVSNVTFYRDLNARDKAQFEARCVSFINATQFIGHDTDVTDEDCLLIAAGAVILAWGFSQWHYVKVDTVYLVGTVIKQDAGAVITGLVGNNHLAGKMVLSKPALHHGFSNDRDKQNVAIHEFAHLIDLADGDADGLPEELIGKAFALPWLNLVQKKMTQIERKQGDIRAYGATNQAEFFAVASEYF